MTIRALIVDDERLGRSRIATLLKPHDDVLIAGECKNGTEAVLFINDNKPDLIFLDVQMPDLDGFGVLDQADLGYSPFIIFATAYDRYALRAFDVHAIDYLLKPFDEERFDAAVERARQQLQVRKTSDFNRKLTALLRDHHALPHDSDGSFEVKDRGRVHQIRADDVLWIQSESNYVHLHLKEGSFLYRSTMNETASSLDPQRFLRIHRSHIVNVAQVKSVRYLNRNNEFEFLLKNGHRLTSARSYRDRIAEYLEGTNLLDK